MGERFQTPMAMWRLQYHLLGGQGRILTVVGVYVALLVLAGFGMYPLQIRPSLARFAGTGVYVLMGLQTLLLMLGGPNAVYRATFRDYHTKMMESHRLTPQSNLSIVFGYWLGATMQILLLVLVNVVLGVVLSLLAGRPVADWLLGNLLMTTGGVLLWGIVVYAGMPPEKPINLAPLLFVIACLSVAGIGMVPGIGVLLGAYPFLMGGTVISGSKSADALSVAGMTLIMFILAAFWLETAAARYRRPDLPAFNALRGLVFLALWLLLGTAGIVGFEALQDRLILPGYIPDDPQTSQWILTMAVALVLALIPVHGAARCRMLSSRGASPRNRWDRISETKTAGIAAVMIILIMGASGRSVWSEFALRGGAESWFDRSILCAWCYSLAACVLALLTLRGVFVLVLNRGGSVLVLTAIFLVIFWAAPTAGDYLRAEMVRDYRANLAFSFVFGCSPLGTLILAWSSMKSQVIVGLIVQSVIAGLANYLAFKAQQLRQRKLSTGDRPNVMPETPSAG
ncbi:MAG: hypothetical protein JSV78_06280 [Phycisphaerales bacterium]|nr:MAG: hypothetical protein JSV78_06280 [Phycisphaerales bacterium]